MFTDTMTYLTHSISRITQTLFTVFLIIFATHGVPALAKPPITDEGVPFSHQSVIDIAKTLAESDYEEPPLAPQSLVNLDYSTYQLIDFQQRAAIWGDSPSKFSIQLFAPGFLYKHLVDIDIVESGQAYPINVTEDSFQVPRESIAKALTEVGKYAGFRLHYPLNSNDYKDEFVVFQGASYFRAASKGQQYGVSARGLAIDVAEPTGEEYPIFRRFWIERPGRDQKAIVVHALLDSPSVTGAYRFGIYPDDPTHMDVSATLFPRKDLPHVGLAPLTSMYMHGTMTPPRTPDYRPAVHDSEALAVTRGNGEHLWRPLTNPHTLQISAFIDENPKGFGLIQRHRNFEFYQDLKANYQIRPSVWIEPVGDWGKGALQLIEIPSEVETNDNIVAYWRPEGGLKKDQPYSYAYRLSWPDDVNPMPNNVRIVRSAGGIKLLNDHREIVIDYSNVPAEQIEAISIDASISQGKILEKRFLTNHATGGGRVFISFDPADADSAELRVQLHKDGKPYSETWLYRWLKPTLFAGP